MSFPQSISLTITNHCNLRCRMCGQWGLEGYIRCNPEGLQYELTLADWQRVVDELADHDIPSLLLRGGEVFLFPQIVELLEYIHARGIFISIDTNGTMLARYAEDIVRIGRMHLTISVDGPEQVHDAVRGVPGTFQRLKAGVARIAELEARGDDQISRSICFTISQYNYRYLGVMPEVARTLGLGAIAIVPYYYFPEKVGRQYEAELGGLGCQAYSWAGFHHEDSGVDFEEFQQQYRQYLATLGEIYSYPYMPLDEDQYRDWFADAWTPVGYPHCLNVEKLIDIQPDGAANFCVDFVDYSFGNIKDATIETLWNGERAERFRRYRRERPLAVCHRCGAKYMSQSWSAYGSAGIP
ncbi:MAG: radical SAM protein [Anaerolineales bacterium]|nr:radical SAM protein [Anaerolineales bacterium]